MSLQKRCNQCREAKVKCDQLHPQCGRCARRNSPCTWPDHSQRSFINQNRVAAKNVRRTRPGRVFDSTTQAEDLESQIVSGRIPWLNREANLLVQPTLYTVAEKLALEFLSKWILFPCNHGVCPGYFQDLPKMYYDCDQDHVLRLAVDSTILGQVGKHENRASLITRSQEIYGKALHRLSQTLDYDTVNDTVFIAILLLDTYETVYLNMRGAHDGGLIKIVRLRGSHQMFKEESFHLWRIAHHRIQASRLLNIEKPMDESDGWMNMLDKTSIDIRVADEGHKVILLNAKAKEVIDKSENPDGLINEMRTLHATMKTTMESTSWLGRVVQPTFQAKDIAQLPLTTSRKTLTAYHDLWAARTWNYHRVCRSMLLLMLVKLQGLKSVEDEEAISEIRILIDAIFDSVPMLFGLMDNNGQPLSHGTNAKDIGLVFLRLPMQAINKNTYSLPRQREEAKQVLNVMLANSFQSEAPSID